MNGTQQPPEQGGYPPQQQGGYPPQQQGGYPPQQGGYPPQQGGYPPQGGAPQRSGAPKVMGILMIIFASLGLLLSLYHLASVGSVSSELKGEFISALKSYGYITYTLGLAIGVLHLVAGIFSVKYKASAPKFSMFYGIGAIAINVLDVVLYYTMVAPKLKELGGAAGAAVGSLGGAMLFVGVIIGSIWPILVIILMNTKKAKASCVN